MKAKRVCKHGVEIPPSLRSDGRSSDCLACHAIYLNAACARSAQRRLEWTPEEVAAFAEYQREYGKRNRAAIRARKRLWRAERRLLAALCAKDELVIQKRRWELAELNELIHVFGAW